MTPVDVRLPYPSLHSLSNAEFLQFLPSLFRIYSSLAYSMKKKDWIWIWKIQKLQGDSCLVDLKFALEFVPRPSSNLQLDLFGSELDSCEVCLGQLLRNASFYTITITPPNTAEKCLFDFFGKMGFFFTFCFPLSYFFRRPVPAKRSRAYGPFDMLCKFSSDHTWATVAEIWGGFGRSSDWVKKRHLSVFISHEFQKMVARYARESLFCSSCFFTIPCH